MYIILYKEEYGHRTFDAATSTPEFITAMTTVCGWTYVGVKSCR